MDRPFGTVIQGVAYNLSNEAIRVAPSLFGVLVRDDRELSQDVSNPMSKQHTSVRSYGVLIDAGRVALVRSSNPRHVPSLWWLPGGGIDFGEAPEDTLVREFREETGLHVANPTLLGVTSDVRRRDNGDKIHTVRILFTVALAGGELHHEVHGTTDHAAWFELKDIETMNIAEYAQAAIASAQGK